MFLTKLSIRTVIFFLLLMNYLLRILAIHLVILFPVYLPFNCVCVFNIQKF